MYSLIVIRVYIRVMDVSITELRANLSLWLDQARSGHEVVITDRGVPVARLMGLNATATLERLTAEGVISRPESGQRPAATGSVRPRPRRPLSDRLSEDRR
jgi:prevent-host-death family protein